MEYLLFLGAGALGALIKDIVKDNKLVMPKFEDGSIALGFIGGVLIGASTGIVVDGNPITAFLAGFTGSQVIEALLIKKKVE